MRLSERGAAAVRLALEPFVLRSDDEEGDAEPAAEVASEDAEKAAAPVPMSASAKRMKLESRAQASSCGGSARAASPPPAPATKKLYCWLCLKREEDTQLFLKCCLNNVCGHVCI